MTKPASTRDAGPVLRCLSLGAGIQSSAVLLMACEGVIPRFDVALFADTGWEPRAVYANLARLRAHAEKFGIPVRTVSAGNIRDDALDPAHRFVSMPLHVLNPDGSRGLARRQCTSEYKISPLKKAARELLGYPHPRRVPRGVYVEQAIGISTDEFTRAKDSGVKYLRNVFPLIDLGWDRTRCADYLAERGFGETVKSACIGCPFHGNAGWRWLRDNDPDGWAEAVEFDRAIRDGYPHATKQGQELRGQYFLHRSCRPLDEVDLDPPRSRKAPPAAGLHCGGGGRRPRRLLAVVVPFRRLSPRGACGMTGLPRSRAEAGHHHRDRGPKSARSEGPRARGQRTGRTRPGSPRQAGGRTAARAQNSRAS